MRLAVITGFSCLAVIVSCGGATQPARDSSPAPSAASTTTAPSTNITESMGTMPAGSEPPAAAQAPAPVANEPAPARAPASDAPSPPGGAAATSPATSAADAMIAGMRPRIRQCYNALLRDHPDFSGTPTIVVTHVNGKVTKVETDCPPAPKVLGECLRKAFESSDAFTGSGKAVLGAPCAAASKK